MKTQTMHFVDGQLFTCFHGVPETTLVTDVPAGLTELMQTICTNFNGPEDRDFYTSPITSLAEVETFFRKLSAAGKMFHPEDDPADIVNSYSLAHIFNPEEAANIRLRIAEVYQFMDDPCAFIMDNTLGA